MDIKLPDLGDVVEVLVKVGDFINPQQDVIELETDKATVRVPASQGG